MNFRDSSGALDLGELSEVWIEQESTPVAGLVIKDGDKCFFNAYDITGDHGPLYLFSFVNEDIIQDMRNGRIELREGFEHYSAFIFKEEVASDGSIYSDEIAFNEIPENLLPETGIFVLGG